MYSLCSVVEANRNGLGIKNDYHSFSRRFSRFVRCYSVALCLCASILPARFGQRGSGM